MGVKTRVCIVSDTHGLEFPIPEGPVDVAVHCGDLTDTSSVSEFRTVVNHFQRIDASLKLVIAGNHDLALDRATFQRVAEEAVPPLDPEIVQSTHSEAKSIMAQASGIVFLDEGTRHFTLANGAALTVYASPYTPSMGNGGFQFLPSEGHDFAIENDVDMVITHGPPRGILDRVPGSGSAGSEHLFTAVERARPRLHCFGHIHGAWGAKLVAWRENAAGAGAMGDASGRRAQSHFTAIDNDRSMVIANRSSLWPGKFDTPELVKEKEKRRTLCQEERRSYADVSAAIAKGEHTLFVNAAIGGPDDDKQLPWLVDIELPVAS